MSLLIRRKEEGEEQSEEASTIYTTLVLHVTLSEDGDALIPVTLVNPHGITSITVIFNIFHQSFPQAVHEDTR